MKVQSRLSVCPKTQNQPTSQYKEMILEPDFILFEAWLEIHITLGPLIWRRRRPTRRPTEDRPAAALQNAATAQEIETGKLEETQNSKLIIAPQPHLFSHPFSTSNVDPKHNEEKKNEGRKN